MEERLLHASKLRLLRFYIWAVSGYAVAYALAILVPLFVLGEPGQEDLAVLVVSLLLDVVKWGFLAALTYIFRRAPWQRESAFACVCLLRQATSCCQAALCCIFMRAPSGAVVGSRYQFVM